MAYIDLATVKLALGITASDKDSLLNKHIAAAEKAIDGKTRGQKAGGAFVLDASVSARTYRTAGRVVCGDDGEALIVEDIGTDTGLVVETGDGTTWSTVAASAYEVGPDNALAKGWPITRIRYVDGCWGVRRVRVTAKWGWPAIPEDIVEAALLQVIRLSKRPDNPEGVAGSADWGLVRMPNLDPDVKAMIAPYMLPGFG